MYTYMYMSIHKCFIITKVLPLRGDLDHLAVLGLE